MARRVYRLVGEWWDTLDEEAQIAINSVVLVLEEVGPALTRPYADTVKGSRHANMRELRLQHQGRPICLLYAFDPRRTAIILVGGDKGGNDRWYDVYIPLADKLYDEHLQQIKSQYEPKEVQYHGSQVQRTPRENVANGSDQERSDGA